MQHGSTKLTGSTMLTGFKMDDTTHMKGFSGAES